MPRLLKKDLISALNAYREKNPDCDFSDANLDNIYVYQLQKMYEKTLVEDKPSDNESSAEESQDESESQGDDSQDESEPEDEPEPEDKPEPQDDNDLFSKVSVELLKDAYDDEVFEKGEKKAPAKGHAIAKSKPKEVKAPAKKPPAKNKKTKAPAKKPAPKVEEFDEQDEQSQSDSEEQPEEEPEEEPESQEEEEVTEEPKVLAPRKKSRVKPRGSRSASTKRAPTNDAKIRENIKGVLQEYCTGCTTILKPFKMKARRVGLDQTDVEVLIEAYNEIREHTDFALDEILAELNSEPDRTIVNWIDRNLETHRFKFEELIEG